jgi:hypothetical protein
VLCQRNELYLSNVESVLPEPVERGERLQRAARTAFVIHARAYVVVNAFLVGVWALAGGGYFWPAWVILGWGLAVVLQAMATFGRVSSR